MLEEATTPSQEGDTRGEEDEGALSHRSALREGYEELEDHTARYERLRREGANHGREDGSTNGDDRSTATTRSNRIKANNELLLQQERQGDNDADSFSSKSLLPFLAVENKYFSAQVEIAVATHLKDCYSHLYQQQQQPAQQPPQPVGGVLVVSDEDEFLLSERRNRITTTKTTKKQEEEENDAMRTTVVQLGGNGTVPPNPSATVPFYVFPTHCVLRALLLSLQGTSSSSSFSSSTSPSGAPFSLDDTQEMLVDVYREACVDHGFELIVQVRPPPPPAAGSSLQADRRHGAWCEAVSDEVVQPRKKGLSRLAVSGGEDNRDVQGSARLLQLVHESLWCRQPRSAIADSSRSSSSVPDSSLGTILVFCEPSALPSTRRVLQRATVRAHLSENSNDVEVRHALVSKYGLRAMDAVLFRPIALLDAYREITLSPSSSSPARVLRAQDWMRPEGAATSSHAQQQQRVSSILFVDCAPPTAASVRQLVQDVSNSTDSASMPGVITNEDARQHGWEMGVASVGPELLLLQTTPTSAVQPPPSCEMEHIRLFAERPDDDDGAGEEGYDRLEEALWLAGAAGCSAPPSLFPSLDVRRTEDAILFLALCRGHPSATSSSRHGATDWVSDVRSVFASTAPSPNNKCFAQMHPTAHRDSCVFDVTLRTPYYDTTTEGTNERRIPVVAVSACVTQEMEEDGPRRFLTQFIERFAAVVVRVDPDKGSLPSLSPSVPSWLHEALLPLYLRSDEKDVHDDELHDNGGDVMQSTTSNDDDETVRLYWTPAPLVLTSSSSSSSMGLEADDAYRCVEWVHEGNGGAARVLEALCSTTRWSRQRNNAGNEDGPREDVHYPQHDGKEEGDGEDGDDHDCDDDALQRLAVAATTTTATKQSVSQHPCDPTVIRPSDFQEVEAELRLTSETGSIKKRSSHSTEAVALLVQGCEPPDTMLMDPHTLVTAHHPLLLAVATRKKHVVEAQQQQKRKTTMTNNHSGDKCASQDEPPSPQPPSASPESHTEVAKTDEDAESPATATTKKGIDMEDETGEEDGGGGAYEMELMSLMKRVRQYGHLLPKPERERQAMLLSLLLADVTMNDGE